MSITAPVEAPSIAPTFAFSKFHRTTIEDKEEEDECVSVDTFRQFRHPDAILEQLDAADDFSDDGHRDLDATDSEIGHEGLERIPDASSCTCDFSQLPG